ncbi:MAG: lycopene cyclase domain-containing protein [Streptosporangiales bacterium]
MPEYTVATLVAAAAVVASELLVFRTGLFRRTAYWITLGVVLAFQVPVDGWLTKLSAPIVLYSRSDFSGIRFPWDIPIEDFGFGFVLTTLTLLLWVRQAGRGSGRRQRACGRREPSRER